MDIIYSIKVGLLKENVRKFKKVLDNYLSYNLDILIAGCTEIPLILPYFEVNIPIIGSKLALAKNIIRFAKGINI